MDDVKEFVRFMADLESACRRCDGRQRRRKGY
jgi:hypothetical protein